MDLPSANWRFDTGEDDFEFANDQFQIVNSTEYPSSCHEFPSTQYSVSSLENAIQQHSSSSSETPRNSNLIFNHKRNVDNTDHVPSTDFLEGPYNKQIKKTSSSFSSRTAELEYVSPKSPAHLISFENLCSKPVSIPNNILYGGIIISSDMKVERGMLHDSYMSSGKMKKVVNQATDQRSPSSYAQDDHANAERKRRERLNEKFIALSALIPTLKKLDKASVIGETVKYLKELEEKAKSLEEQAKTKKSGRVVADDDGSSSSTSTGDNSGAYYYRCRRGNLPEIQARVSDKNVLIRIHCEKKTGVLVQLLRKLQNLHLSVVNSSVLPFGDYAMDVVIIAQMDPHFSIISKDLVSKLRLESYIN